MVHYFRKKIFIAVFLFTAGFIVFIPSLSLAQTSNSSTGATFKCPDNFSFKNGICIPDQAGGTTGSIAASSTLNDILVTVIKWLLTIAGVIAVAFVVVGGYWYITSAGNEEQSEKGRKTLTNAIIGVIVVVLAYTIVTVIVNTLTSTK